MRTGSTMWLHKQTINNIVTLAFSPQYLAYAHIKKTNNQIPYSMINYKYIPLNNLELEKQIIFNPTQIGKQLHALLSEQKLSDADIRISLSGPTIFETIVALSDKSIDELHGTQLKNLVWEDMPVFQHAQSNQQIYVCGISRELLFQYQLLAIKHKLNIRCITTSNLALLSAYHALLTDNIDKNCAKIEDIASLLASQPLNRICSDVPSTNNPVLMAELIGLCLSELPHENN